MGFAHSYVEQLLPPAVIVQHHLLVVVDIGAHGEYRAHAIAQRIGKLLVAEVVQADTQADDDHRTEQKQRQAPFPHALAGVIDGAEEEGEDIEAEGRSAFGSR